MSEWEQAGPEDIEVPFSHPWIEAPYFFDMPDDGELSLATQYALLQEADKIAQLLPNLTPHQEMLTPYLHMESDAVGLLCTDLVDSELLEVYHALWVWPGRLRFPGAEDALLRVSFRTPEATGGRGISLTLSREGLFRNVMVDDAAFAEVVAASGLNKVGERIGAVFLDGIRWYREVLEIEVGRWPCLHQLK
jgi:hypothetical protein